MNSNKLPMDNLSHNLVAKYLLNEYKNIFCCASIKHNLWYEFKNHRWVMIDSAFSLRNLISNELVIEYTKRQTQLYQLAKEKQGYEKERCFDQAAQICKIIKQLQNTTFKNGVIRECADITYDPNFLNNLDENVNLICFENGVYDLSTGEFRDGRPNDYISLCTNYDYVKYNKNDEHSEDIKNIFLNKIQPDKTMRKFLMTLLSTCLCGSVLEDDLYIFTGSGASGISKLMELMRYTMGDLFKPMDVRLLMGKKKSSAIALADKKGIRMCTFDEPIATDETKLSFIEIMTGCSTISVRALYKEPIYFRPQIKPFLMCNHLPVPKEQTTEHMFWPVIKPEDQDKIKVIHFPSKFIKASDANMKKNGLTENQFFANVYLSDYLPKWRQMFMGMLIKYFKKYRNRGLVYPEQAKQHTMQYKKIQIESN